MLETQYSKEIKCQLNLTFFCKYDSFMVNKARASHGP